jgi:hypothetical protein
MAMARSTIVLDPQKSLVRVGDGRGFVIQARERFRERYVVTAAHCLPTIPEPLMRGEWDETFQDVLGPLGGAPTVWVECLYVDPISDIAVLGKPDDQSLFTQAEAYDVLTEGLVPLRVGDIAPAKAPIRLVALDGRLIDCTAHHQGGRLLIETAPDDIAPGMSGSPVLSRAGVAIGIVSLSSGTEHQQNQGISPRLIVNLPGWLLLKLGVTDVLVTARRELRAFYRRQEADLWNWREKVEVSDHLARSADGEGDGERDF